MYRPKSVISKLIRLSGQGDKHVVEVCISGGHCSAMLRNAKTW